MKDGLKILSAEIKNFKGITHKEVDFGGRSLMVVGPNDAQKSSFIQAVMCAMDSKYKPTAPIKEGEERASVSVKLGGMAHGKEAEYTVEIYFSPDNQKGRLVLLDHEGKKIPSPASSLDMVIGNIGFDIDEFIQLSKTKSGAFSKEGAMKQVEILKAFLPKEIREELFKLDQDIKEIKESRQEINREVKNLTEKLKHDYSDEQLEKYKDPIDIAPIQKKITDIGEDVQNYSKALRKKEDVMATIAKIEAETKLINPEAAKHNFDAITNCIESLKHPNEHSVVTFKVHANKYLKDLSDRIALYNTLPAEKLALEKLDKWFAKNKKPDTAALMKELNDANEHNEEHKKVKELGEMHKLLTEKQKDYEDLKTDIELMKDRKKAIFSNNPLPVKRLSFDEEQVLYDGLPFTTEQLPSSTIIGVGVRIAMAMNPNLKVIVIKDGSLLDKKTANGILKMIEKEGYQLLIEMVDWNGSQTELKFIEKEIA